MATITIDKNEFQELSLYRKLVKNNLLEELTQDELQDIISAKKTNLMSEEEFFDKNPIIGLN
jgi:hypothetical protein